jgi:3-oxoacyl-[acyl-carrier protein] reductase
VTAAFVTGAAGGIGSAVVARLVAGGATVAALDRDPVSARAGVHSVPVDLADPVACVAAARTARDLLGHIDVIVNNAGVMHKKALPDHSLADWDTELAVNARAAFLLCRELVPGMADRGTGSVVNVASIWASRGGPDRSAYIAAKHALLGLTRALAAEYGDSGVRVNSVSPGPVRTPMTTGLGGDQAMWMEPDEVAAVVMFLCSSEASGVYGADIAVTGRGRPAGL